MADVTLFLFDMAGTTVRDDGQVLETFLAVAHEAGLHPDREVLRSRMGWYKREVFAGLLEEAGRTDVGADDLVARFNAHLAAAYRAAPPEPLPGAEPSMAALRAAGIRYGFTTGFTAETARLLVELLGWQPDVVVASDEVAHGRPAPDLILEAMARTGVTDPARVGVCGDTPSDLEAGTRAGCGYVIGVGHGTHALEELAAAPHTALLADLTTLPEVLGLA